MVLEKYQDIMDTPGMKNRLREIRDSLTPRMSQQRLADLANTFQPQIDRLEKSQRKLTKEWADRLAPHLGCSPAELLYSEDELADASADPAALTPDELALLDHYRSMPEDQKEVARSVVHALKKQNETIDDDDDDFETA